MTALFYIDIIRLIELLLQCAPEPPTCHPQGLRALRPYAPTVGPAPPPPIPQSRWFSAWIQRGFVPDWILQSLRLSRPLVPRRKHIRSPSLEVFEFILFGTRIPQGGLCPHAPGIFRIRTKAVGRVNSSHRNEVPGKIPRGDESRILALCTATISLQPFK